MWPLDKLLNFSSIIIVDRLLSPSHLLEERSIATFITRWMYWEISTFEPQNIPQSIFFKGPRQGLICLLSGTLSKQTQVSLLSWTILMSIWMIHHIFQFQPQIQWPPRTTSFTLQITLSDHNHPLYSVCPSISSRSLYFLQLRYSLLESLLYSILCQSQSLLIHYLNHSY